MLVTWTSINDVQANFSWSVFAPEAHSVDVLIGGRIGTYPSIAAPGGSSPGLTPP